MMDGKPDSYNAVHQQVWQEEFTFFISSCSMLLDGGTEDIKFIALGICDFYVLWSSSVITYLVSAPGK